jgi:cytochrome P450
MKPTWPIVSGRKDEVSLAGTILRKHDETREVHRVESAKVHDRGAIELAVEGAVQVFEESGKGFQTIRSDLGDDREEPLLGHGWALIRTRSPEKVEQALMESEYRFRSMSFDARRLVLPLVHRFVPTPGPGGFVDFVLSKVLDADAGNTIHVTRYFDRMEVLERHDDFSVRTYDERMTATTGEFLLGMDDQVRYDRDARVISQGIKKTDGELLHRIASEETRAALKRVRGTGRLDVVKDLVEPVVIRSVVRFFGTAVEDVDDLLRLYRTVSKFLFAFWFDPAMRDEAVEAGSTLRDLLGSIVAERRRTAGSGHRQDDVLGRFVDMQTGFYDGDTGIVRTVAGLSSGAITAPVGLCVYSIDTLLSLPEEVLVTVRRLATEAAHGSTAAAERFREYLDEAGRFSVYPPFNYRYAERDTTIASGTSRAKRIAKGSTVVVWHALTAFDDDVFERPFDFRPGRPQWQYSGFGHGRHWCLGEHVGQALLFEMALGLFAMPGFHRAPGKAGRVQTRAIREGRFPLAFTAEFVKHGPS